MRQQVAAVCKEALDGIEGMDQPEAWALRDDHADRWPSTVVKSLGPLADGARGQEPAAPTARRAREQRVAAQTRHRGGLGPPPPANAPGKIDEVVDDQAPFDVEPAGRHGHRCLSRRRRVRDQRSHPDGIGRNVGRRGQRRHGPGRGRRRRQRHGRPVAAAADQDRKLVDVPGHRRARRPHAEDPDGDGTGTGRRGGAQRRRDGVPLRDQKRHRRHGRNRQLAGACRDDGGCATESSRT